MHTLRAWLVAATCIVLLGGPVTACPIPSTPWADLAFPAEGKWVAKTEDNICGLRDPKKLSNPAKVDFKKLCDATPEMKRIVRDGIERSSPEGIQLTQQAIDRVTRSGKTVMGDKGHCSVWKEIRNTDGREVPDLTQAVLEKL